MKYIGQFEVAFEANSDDEALAKVQSIKISGPESADGGEAQAVARLVRVVDEASASEGGVAISTADDGPPPQS